MRAFFQTQILPQGSFPSLARSNSTVGPSLREHPTFLLQRAIGSPSVQQPQTDAAELMTGTTGLAPPRLRHDFSRISVHSPTAREREAAGDAEHVAGERVAYKNQTGRPLPFVDTVQRSFGRHDISHIRAHTGSEAATKAWAIGADAFAQGQDVTFLRPPSLQTSAHEAAHVLQQQAGVDIPGGMGREGDAYERHADEVADRTARGQSGEALLDAFPGARGLHAGPGIDR